METFKDRLEQALALRDITPAELSRLSGVNEGAISQYRSGAYKASQRSLEKLSKALNVSIPWLMGADVPINDIKEPSASPLTNKDKRDIAQDIADLRAALESGDTLMFEGDPMSDEARASILSAMELGLQAAKLKNKEKYTPKKYRKD